jgi:phospholipid/cholesterol/gamma-HCH transport system permease protein
MVMNNPDTIHNPVSMPERLDRRWVEQNKLHTLKPGGTLRLDFSSTKTIDSAGISLIHFLNNQFKRAGQKVVLSNISEELLQTLKKWSTQVPQEPAKEKKGLFVSIGDKTIGAANEMVKAVSIFVETLYWGTFGLFRRQDYRRGIMGEQMYQLGYNATPIVGLLSFIIGVIMSIQSALQLRQFGADVFLVAMITWGMVRELGPLMTAIILAARSGSATTAEIATMCVQEEVDALKTMGLNHIQFIVVPKLWAISITMPVLAILSMVFGILGGFVVSTFYVNLSPDLFWSEMVKNIYIKDFIISVIKSVVFSWLIIWIGAYYGFKVRGGAEEVGKETTASVVTALFVIIVADAFFSFIYDIKF